MPKGTNQKLNLYRLSQIMLRETNKDYGLFIQENKNKLVGYGITIDSRKGL